MPAIASGQSQNITIQAGEVLNFDAGGAGIAAIADGQQAGQQYRIGTSAQSIGPFSTARTISVSATAALSYFFGDKVFDVEATQTEEGPTLTGDAAGAVVGAASDLAGVLMPYTDDSFIATQAGCAKAGAGRVETVTCTQGASIVVTLYDNTVAGTGAVIWTGTMSAGDVVAPPSAFFTNGCYVSYTGTATFIINHTEDI